MRSVAVREDIRDLILDATGRLLGRYGYARMTMEDLAREVGIGKGTIYLHFPSKEEVVLSRIDRMVDTLVAELRRRARSGRDPAVLLREMLVLRVLHRFDAARHYAESLSEMLAAIRPGLLARRERHFALEAAVLAEVLGEGRRAGAFSFGDAAATAHALVLATNALLPYSLSVKELGRRSGVEARASGIATLLIDGLRARGIRPARRKA